MRFWCWSIVFLLAATSVSRAEVLDTDNGALAIFGTGCEATKADEQNASTRLKATDKACYSAVSSLPEIVSIKDSFDDHDFNVMVYNIVDEYIEDMVVKTTKQDNAQICVEVSGYITPENIGKAIDETIQTPDENSSAAPVDAGAVVAQNAPTEVAPANVTPEVTGSVSVSTPEGGLLQPPSEVIEPESNIIILSTIFVKPTEFYNHTQSNSHSKILKNILARSSRIQIVDNEEDANFVVTPKVLKAKIEPLNSETSRMQMVLALETFDRNKNTTETEHQNKFVMFNNSDDEQGVAKSLLSQMFEQGGSSIIRAAEKSSGQVYKQQQKFLPEVITAMPQRQD